jgi:hypothetical protein
MVFYIGATLFSWALLSMLFAGQHGLHPMLLLFNGYGLGSMLLSTDSWWLYWTCAFGFAASAYFLARIYSK